MPVKRPSDETGGGSSTRCLAEEERRRRVRENQRKSRQKRKDHMAAMTDKVRQQDAQRVQATVEMQAVARTVMDEKRKVLDENGKLRHLLRMQGVSDAVIGEFLISGKVRHHSLPGYLHNQPVSTAKSNADLQLERLLGQQQPSCLPNGTASAKTRTSEVIASARGEVNSHRDGLTSSMVFQPAECHPSQQAQYMIAPGSAGAVTRTDAAMALTGLGQVNAEQSSAAVSGGPLPTPPYNYNMQPFTSAPGYSQQQPDGQEILLRGPVGPLTGPPNYLPTQPREVHNDMATYTMSGLTSVNHHNVRGQLCSVPGSGPHVDNMNLSFNNVMENYTYRRHHGDDDD